MKVIVCYSVMKDFDVSEEVVNSLKTGEDWNNFAISSGVNFDNWDDVEIQGVYQPTLEWGEEVIWEQ